MSIYTVIASFVSGVLCSMGFGAGSVLIIYLTSFLSLGQREAQGINLFFFLPISLYSVMRYSKKGLVEKDIIRPYIIWGIAGICAGYSLLSLIPTEFLTKAFGGFLIVLGIKDLFIKK